MQFDYLIAVATSLPWSITFVGRNPGMCPTKLTLFLAIFGRSFTVLLVFMIPSKEAFCLHLWLRMCGFICILSLLTAKEHADFKCVNGETPPKIAGNNSWWNLSLNLPNCLIRRQ